MKIKRKYIFVIALTLLITTYIAYGYYIGFNCRFILSNNLTTRYNPDLYPANPDLTVRVSYDVLFQLNLPSDRLHEDVVLKKRLKIGYSYIEARSDTMAIYSSNIIFVLYPRNIYIGIDSSVPEKHVTIYIF